MDPPPLPVEHNVEEFVDWVAARDVLQLPDDVTQIGDLKLLPRRLPVLLHDCPNLQLFSYRPDPGFTTAQIRDSLHLGW